MSAGYVAGRSMRVQPHCAQPAPSPAASTGNSLEVFGVLRDGHVDDVQGVLVVLLGGEEESQQVERVGVIPAQLQGLLQLLHGAGDLPEKTTSSVTFPKAHSPLHTLVPGAIRGHETQVRPWALGEGLGLW